MMYAAFGWLLAVTALSLFVAGSSKMEKNYEDEEWREFCEENTNEFGYLIHD